MLCWMYSLRPGGFIHCITIQIWMYMVSLLYLKQIAIFLSESAIIANSKTNGRMVLIKQVDVYKLENALIY